MDNSVLRSAMVAANLSSPIVDLDHTKETTTDWTAATLAERLTFNLDRRTVAIGGNEEIWLIDLLSSSADAWFAMIRSMNDAVELMVSTKRPARILSFSPGIGAGMHKWINQNPDASITFVNGPLLDVYEQHMMSASTENTVSEYDVIDFDDLESVLADDEKFDFIFAMAFDIVSDLDIQQKCVNALAPHGVLYVALTNNGGKLYRDDYHTHPYSDFHQFLLSCDGHSYHVPAHYGYTVFIKN